MGVWQHNRSAPAGIGEEYDRVYYGLNDPVLKDSGKGKQLRIVNHAGWKDTVLWNPFGNQGMGPRVRLRSWLVRLETCFGRNPPSPYFGGASVTWPSTCLGYSWLAR